MWIHADTRMLIFCLVLSILSDFCASAVDYLKHPLKPCNVGDTIQNECNKCVCTTKAIFECTALNCNDTSNILKAGEDLNTCLPNLLYAQNLISCICTKDGKWPHKSCHETFHSLPPNNVIKHSCEPDTYVVIDCNVCKCGPSGNILTDQCTKNVCDDDIKRRMVSKPSSVYGNCEIQNWYSLAPCQFCFCANENRLVCNTGNHYSKNLELGSYNLVVCGKDLIKDALELIPETEKVLRLGLQDDERKKATTKTITVRSPRFIDIEVDKNDKNIVKTKISDSDEEYYSSSEEETTVHTSKAASKVTTLYTTPKIVRTQNPYQEGDETNNENDYESDKKEASEENSSNEISVEVPILVSTAKPKEGIKHEAKDPKLEASNAESLTAFGETLKINLPKVLNKVFQMALRKSMVSLNSESKCTPGSTSMKQCNMCFCLKNSKLLCTNNHCD